MPVMIEWFAQHGVENLRSATEGELHDDLNEREGDIDNRGAREVGWWWLEHSLKNYS